MTPNRKPLGMFDAIGLIVGIIIGAGIFQSPPDVFLAVDSPLDGMLLWVAGALVGICGALCYAELAATYQSNAGEGEYFRRAFGPAAGWFFTWTQLVSVRTAAAVVSIAYVFANYAVELAPAPSWLYAGGAIIALTAINALGLVPGKRTQNILALAKLLAISAVIVAGFAAIGVAPPVGPSREPKSLAFALVVIFYTYSGWHEAAYIVGDMREPQRNLPRAMMLGVGTVALVYLLVNVSALLGLGFVGLQDTERFGSTLMTMAGWNSRWFAAIVVIITLGSINGTILSGSRLFAAVGATQPGYGLLARGISRRNAPLAALAVQAGICLAMVAALEVSGTGKDGFGRVVAATSPVLWLVFMMAGVALIVLRRKEPDRERLYRVPLYPVLPMIYVLSCAFMLFEATEYALTQQGPEWWLTLGLLAAGVPYWLFVRVRGSSHQNADYAD